MEKKPKEFTHVSVKCSLQMCEAEAVQWLDIVSKLHPLYLCEEHTVDSEEFPETAVYSCSEECPVCKHN